MTSTPAERLKLAQAYLAERAERNPLLTPSITFGNASPCRPLYTGNSMSSARVEADQHLLHKSVGMAAQIVRAV